MRLSGMGDLTTFLHLELLSGHHNELAGSSHWHLEATLAGHVFFRNLCFCFKML